MTTERIDRAAIKLDGAVWSADQGSRHFVVLSRIVQQILQRARDHGVEGFITTTGRFVDREEALRIAATAGQLNGQPIAAGKLFVCDLVDEQQAVRRTAR